VPLGVPDRSGTRPSERRTGGKEAYLNRLYNITDILNY